MLVLVQVFVFFFRLFVFLCSDLFSWGYKTVKAHLHIYDRSSAPTWRIKVKSIFLMFCFFFSFPFVCPLTGVMFLRWFLVSRPGFVHPAWPECQPRPWPLLFHQSLTSFSLSSSPSSLSLLSLLAPPLNEPNQHGFPPSSLLSPPSFLLWFPLCACIFSALTSNMIVRLHPSPHLLITQQIHGNMYLWLSWDLRHNM